MTYREARRRNRAGEEMLQVALGALGGGLVGAKLSMLLFLGPATFVRDLPPPVVLFTAATVTTYTALGFAFLRL